MFRCPRAGRASAFWGDQQRKQRSQRELQPLVLLLAASSLNTTFPGLVPLLSSVANTNKGPRVHSNRAVITPRSFAGTSVDAKGYSQTSRCDRGTFRPVIGEITWVEACGGTLCGPPQPKASACATYGRKSSRNNRTIENNTVRPRAHPLRRKKLPARVPSGTARPAILRIATTEINRTIILCIGRPGGAAPSVRGLRVSRGEASGPPAAANIKN